MCEGQTIAFTFADILKKCYFSLKLVYVVTYILFVRPIIPIFMCGTNGKDTLPSSSSRIE